MTADERLVGIGKSREITAEYTNKECRNVIITSNQTLVPVMDQVISFQLFTNYLSINGIGFYLTDSYFKNAISAIAIAKCF